MNGLIILKVLPIGWHSKPSCEITVEHIIFQTPFAPTHLQAVKVFSQSKLCSDVYRSNSNTLPVIWVYVIFDWKRYSITIVSSFFIVYMVVSTVNDILVLRMIDLVTIRVFVKVIGIYRENPLVMIESNNIYFR